MNQSNNWLLARTKVVYVIGARGCNRHLWLPLVLQRRHLRGARLKLWPYQKTEFPIPGRDSGSPCALPPDLALLLHSSGIHYSSLVLKSIGGVSGRQAGSVAMETAAEGWGRGWEPLIGWNFPDCVGVTVPACHTNRFPINRWPGERGGGRGGEFEQKYGIMGKWRHLSEALFSSKSGEIWIFFWILGAWCRL